MNWHIHPRQVSGFYTIVMYIVFDIYSLAKSME